MPHLVVCSCDPKRLSHFFVPPPLVGGGCGSKIIKNRNPEIQPTSPLAMERCTRGAKAVEEVFLERMAILFSPLRRGGFLQNPDLLGFRTLRGRRGTLAWTRTTRSGARGLLVDSMACAVAVRFVDEVGVEEDDAEAAARSRRAMGLCTRGAKAVAEVFLERKAIIFSPLRRERSRRNTPALTRTTRSGARSFGVALGIISRPKKCLFDPGLKLMESLREINKVATTSAEYARGRTLRFLFSKPVLFPLMV